MLFLIIYSTVIFYPLLTTLVLVLAHENKKYLLKIKESLLIMRNKPSLKRNIDSATLYLFDEVNKFPNKF